jgi:hypothetical protein
MKRGQTTIFIILGIIIIIVALGVSFIKNEQLIEKIGGEVFESVVVPEQAQGVVNFVNNCIQDIAEEGLDILGLQGGYINLPGNIVANPRTYLKFTDSISIPYWLYSESSIRIPSTFEMEEDLEAFIEERFVEECSFNIYDELGSYVDGEIDVHVEILESLVNVELNSPLSVEIKGNFFDLDKYVFVSVSSRLGEFYEMGVEFIERELGSGMDFVAPLEYNTFNMIALWSKDPANGIPKVSGFDFSCEPDRYELNTVGEKLKDLIFRNTFYLQLEGTKSRELLDPFYNNMIIDNIFSRNHNDVDAQITFSDSGPFVLDITPRNGGLLKSSVMKAGLPLFGRFCFNSHDFRYDVSYPVVVSFEADGYLFQFPVEVNIVDNYGRRNVLGVDTPININTPSLFCNQNQRISGEMKISAVDSLDDEELVDVGIEYGCGGGSCFIGKINENQGIIEFRGQFPLCYGGELKLTKEGYAPYRERLDTLVSGSQSILGVMKPYRELNVDFEVINLDLDNEIVGVPRDLKVEEKVVLNLNRYSDVFGDNFQNFDESTIVVYEGNEEIKVNLVPGKYNVVLDLILDKTINLEGQIIEGYEFSEQEVDTVILGHIEYDIDVTLEDLENENVKFTAFGIEPMFVGDLTRGYNLEDVVEANRGALNPVYT